MLAAAASCMRERLVERPHVVSLLGEVLVLALLPALRDGRRRAWWLVPMVALWANLHAGAFAGPLLVALAGLGVLFEGVISPSPAPRRAFFNHALAAVLCGAALMATPVGPGIFRYLTFHADIFAIHPVDEFRPLAWHSDATLIIYAGALTLALGLCAALHVRPRLRDLLPVVGLALLAGRHVRFGADFALVAAILAAPVLTALPARWAGRIAPVYRAHFDRATGALLALLALGSYLRWCETPERWSWLVPYTVLATLACLVKPTALQVPLAAVVMVVIARRTRRHWKAVLLAHSVIACIGIAYLLHARHLYLDYGNTRGSSSVLCGSSCDGVWASAALWRSLSWVCASG